MCFARCGLPSVPESLRGGEAVQRGVTAERGEEHPEERRQPADGPAAAAAEPDARGQEAKVSMEVSYLFITLQRHHHWKHQCRDSSTCKLTREFNFTSYNIKKDEHTNASIILIQ